jgi:hypothetical protein
MTSEIFTRKSRGISTMLISFSAFHAAARFQLHVIVCKAIASGFPQKESVMVHFPSLLPKTNDSMATAMRRRF